MNTVEYKCCQCHVLTTYTIDSTVKSRRKYCAACAIMRKNMCSMYIKPFKAVEKNDEPNMRIVFAYDEVSVLI